MKYLLLLFVFCGTIFAQCGLPTGFQLEKVSLSADFVGSTVHSEAYSGQLLLTETEDPCFRTVLNLVPAYTESKKGAAVPTITRNYSGQVQQLWLHPNHPHFVNYALMDEYHNNALGVLLRQSYGSGAAFIDKRFEFDIDFRYINEQFYKPGIRDSNLFGFGLKPRYSVPLNFIAKNSILAFSEEYIPVVNKDKAWMSNSVMVLSIPFRPKWYFTVSGGDSFLADSPYTFRRNYAKVSIGITYNHNGVMIQ